MCDISGQIHIILNNTITSYERRFTKKLTWRKKLLGEELLLGELPLPINELKENADTTTRLLLHLPLRDSQILGRGIIHFCNTPQNHRH